MIEITKYKAIDGKIFSSEKKCLEYEIIAKQVASFLDKLPLRGNVHGDGYVQHEDDMKGKLSKLTIKLANDWFGKDTFTSMSYALGRYIDDSNMSCLSRLMSVYMCTDSNGKQWNQPFFAGNPDKGVDKKLN